MSTRRFCDFCGGEIEGGQCHTGAVSRETTLRRKVTHQPYSVVVAVTVTFKDDAGPDICPRCVFGAVRDIDPYLAEAFDEDCGPDPNPDSEDAIQRGLDAQMDGPS